jgi:hypothetical protein
MTADGWPRIEPEEPEAIEVVCTWCHALLTAEAITTPTEASPIRYVVPSHPSGPLPDDATVSTAIPLCQGTGQAVIP